MPNPAGALRRAADTLDACAIGDRRADALFLVAFARFNHGKIDRRYLTLAKFITYSK